MTENFFDAFAPQEKQACKEKVAMLKDGLEAWIVKYPCLRATRIPSAALLAAIGTPRQPATEALTIAKIVIWIFGIDDKIDERVYTPKDMRRQAENWYALAQGGPQPGMAADDELTAVLLELREALTQSPLFEPLREMWALHVRGLVEAMLQEHLYGLEYATHGPAVLPSMETYIRNARYSVGFPLWASMAVILLRDESIMPRLEKLNVTIQQAASAIRLFNDLQTYGKEKREPKINSLVILLHRLRQIQLPLSEANVFAEANRQVLGLAEHYAQLCHASCSQLQTTSGQIEDTFSRVVDFNAYFYQAHDYHITTTAQIKVMLS